MHCPTSPYEEFMIVSLFKIDKNDRIDQHMCDYWLRPENCDILKFKQKRSLKHYCISSKRNNGFVN